MNNCVLRGEIKERLKATNLRFRGAVNRYLVGLKNYQYDIDDKMGKEILVRVSTASVEDINAALENAVKYAQTTARGYPAALEERGNTFINIIAREILPKYPDLVFLVETLDDLQLSIDFYNHFVQQPVTVAVGDGAVGELCNVTRAAVIIVIVTLMLAAIIGTYIQSRNT